MTVYVLTRGLDYEGEDIIGVYASIDNAMPAADKSVKEVTENDVEWKDKDGGRLLTYGSYHWSITPWEVE